MYQIRLPHPDLAAAIENYWFVTPDVGPVDLRVDVFVDGRPDLIFTFGAPYSREVLGSEPVLFAHSNLDAQRTVPIRIVQRGWVRQAGVRFRLGGLGPVTDVFLRTFTNQTPPPATIFGPEVEGVEAALREGAPDEAASALDQFFLDRLRVDAGRAAVEQAIGVLALGEGTSAVSVLARRVGVSGRQLDRLFAHHVGLPPKMVARILRFQGSLRALMRDPGVPLAQVAADRGYFDQAHFIRDFKRMSGGVPRGYRGYFPPAGPDDFAPNVVAFVQAPSRRPSAP